MSPDYDQTGTPNRGGTVSQEISNELIVNTEGANHRHLTHHSRSAGEFAGLGVDADFFTLLNVEGDLDLEASLQPGKLGDIA